MTIRFGERTVLVATRTKGSRPPGRSSHCPRRRVAVRDSSRCERIHVRSPREQASCLWRGRGHRSRHRGGRDRDRDLIGGEQVQRLRNLDREQPDEDDASEDDEDRLPLLLRRNGRFAPAGGDRRHQSSVPAAAPLVSGVSVGVVVGVAGTPGMYENALSSAWRRARRTPWRGPGGSRSEDDGIHAEQTT